MNTISKDPGCSAAIFTRYQWSILIVTGFFVVSACLSFFHLDHTYLWDDESRTAIFAKTLVNTGKLSGWDGRNLVAYRNGTLLDEQLRPRDVLPQIWVTALSFRCLGVSTWTARFPFVVTGLLTLCIFAYLLLKLESLDPYSTTYSFGCLALSVVFLLNIRQCHYYALALFFSVAGYASYRSFLRTRRAIPLMLLTAGLAGGFYNNPLLGTCFLLALAFSHLVCHRHALERSDWLKVVQAGLVFALITVPYVLEYRIWVRPDMTFVETPQAISLCRQKLTMLFWNFRDLSSSGYFPWVIALGTIWVICRKRREIAVKDTVLPWLVLVFTFVVSLSVLSPQQATIASADVRYLLPILPFTMALAGWFVAELYRWRPSVGAACFMLILASNLFSLAPFNSHLSWWLPAYVKEVSQDYSTSPKVVAEYLSGVAARDELILCCPDYFNDSLGFYLGDRFFFGPLLQKPTAPLSEGKLHDLGAPLFVDENFPDWIVMFGWRKEGDAEIIRYFSRPHEERDVMLRFQYELATNLNVYWFDTSRPDYPWHEFSPRQKFNPGSQSVYVFRRIAP